MQKRQVKKLMALHAIVGELKGAGEAWEVELINEAEMERFCALVVPVGGYKTGYDSWILRPGYRCDEFDFNHQASRHHY